MLVLVAWLGIWLATGAWDTLTPSVVGLIGISAGTALGAVLIDQSKDAAAAAAGGSNNPPGLSGGAAGVGP